ncbi:zf-CCHC domain-containing protein [Tanacetum coccineum]
MDSDKYLEGKSMQRPPLFESVCFIYWKNIFETYVKAKNLDLWYIILNGDFLPVAKNEVTQILEEVPFEQQDDNLKKKLAKNDEAKMVLYSTLPKKEYERIFMCKMAKDIWKSLLITHQGNSQVKDNKIDLLVQQYEQFTILEEESIDSGFARFNTIITSLKALDEGFSSQNHVRKFLRALHPKWRAKVTAIEESKDLSSLALDELIGNLKVHEVVMEKDSEIYRGKKERVKSIALKAKKESSDDETLTSGSDDKEYAMAVTVIKESKDLSSLAIDELIGNLKVHEVVMEKDSEMYRCKKERVKSIALKAKKESSDDETFLMAQSSNEVTLNSCYYSDNASSLDNDIMQLEYDNLCEISLKIINKNKVLKTKRDLLGKEILELNEKIKKLERNKEIDITCKLCQELKLENTRLKETQVKFVKFDKSANSLREMLNNQKIALDGSTIKAYGSTIPGSVDPSSSEKAAEHVFSPPMSSRSDFVITRKKLIHNKIEESKKPSLKSSLKSVEESLNVTFDESPPPTKLSPLVDDDVGEKEAIENNTKVDLVPLPMSQTVIGTKWVFRNKLDKNGIVSKNKARLKAQGYNQQEGIDYDETYAPVARLESIRILLAIACVNDFKLYQMDFEMSMMGELNFFFCLQIKQMEDGIFLNQCKYINEMLKKFGLEDSKPTKTPMSMEIKLTKDDEDDSIDNIKYREFYHKFQLICNVNNMSLSVGFTIINKSFVMTLEKFGEVLQIPFKGTCVFSKECSLELLNTSNEKHIPYQSNIPNIMDVISSISIPSIHQNHSNPSIILYENLPPNIKDWELIIRENVICVDTHKSSIDSCSANQEEAIKLMTFPFSLTGEAKFADTHNMVVFLAKPAESEGFEQILQALVDGKKIIITESIVRRDLQLEDAEGVDCLPNATIFKQITLMGSKTTAWNEFSSTMASTIICLATNQKFNFSKYIFESMVKNLDDVGKFLMYPRFVQVFMTQQLDGLPSHKRIYVTPSHTKKIFGNMKMIGKGFFGRVTPLFPTMVVHNLEELGEGSAMSTDPHHIPTIIQPSTSQPQKTQKPKRPKRKDTKVPQPSGHITNVADEAINEELDDSLVRAATTASCLEAEQDSGNINKTQSKATPNEPISSGTSSGGGPRRQETMGDTIAQIRSEIVSKLSNDPLLARGNTLRSGEDSLKLQELMALCTTLQSRVLALETIKTTQANEIVGLKRRVKKLERRNKLRTHGLKRLYKVGSSRRVESSDNQGLGEEDASKQGRIADIDANKDIYLVNVHTDEDMFGVNDIDGDEVIMDNVDVVKTAKEIFNAAATIVSTASTIPVSAATTTTTLTTTTDATTITAASIRPKVKGIVIHEQE